MWDDVGKFRPTGFGLDVTPWSDIAAYVSVNDIAKWEAKLIHAMSKAFVEAKNAYNEERCEPPHLNGGYTFSELSAMASDAKMIGKK